MIAERLSAPVARRIALAAQGFADRLPTSTPTAAHLTRVIGRTKLIQMDSVNIVARAHYLPMFSRVGAYDTTILHRAAWGSDRHRRLVEYWAHEAALVPVADWPLFRWRMDEFADGRYRFTREVMNRNRHLADDVRAVIAERGASTPRAIEDALGIERKPGQAGSWWQRGEIKHLCEAMFAAGDLAAVRNENFVRHYDLTTRVIGKDLIEQQVDRAGAHRELTIRAAQALGVATLADLADYYRTKSAEVRPIVADLVADGILRPAAVDGWRDPAYLFADTRIPRRIERSTILSPFDPLVFFRPRAERLFGFRYRIEIYVPAHKRVHGYYVLPYLLGTDLVGRVDLKADRKAGTLIVLAAFLEPDRSAVEVADRLAADLHSMAGWLGLDRVVVGRRGDLSAPLRSAVANYSAR